MVPAAGVMIAMIARRLTPLLWLAYIVAPVPGWGLFAGRPLGIAGIAALSALCWLWWLRRSLPFQTLIAGALLLKLAGGSLAMAPRGFDATYFAGAEPSGAAERSTEGASPAFTRVDDVLAFGPDRDRDLPAHFFNDVNRFNFYMPGQPDRVTLPMSAAWKGYLHIAEPGVERFYVRGAGARITMAIDDALLAQTPESSTEWRGDARLPAGWHRVVVTVAIPQGMERRVEAGRVAGGRDRPFDTSFIFRAPVSTGRLAIDRAARVTAFALDSALAAWLLFAVLFALRDAGGRLRASFAARDALAIVWVMGIVDALIFALPVAGRLVVLSGGDDWLTYETMARDVGLNGPWMAGGAPLGHGRPFYLQPLYPYFLAAVHWLTGDGLSGIYFAQRLLAAAALVAMWRTTAVLFDERVGLAGLLAAIVVVYTKLAVWSGVLLTETLFVPLVCIWAYLLVRLATARSVKWRHAALAGAIGGLATLTRSTLVVAWVVALPVLFFALAGHGRRRWPVLAALIATMLAVVSLATLRNWVVARELVPIAASGSANLFIGNDPKVKLVVPPAHKAAYDRFGLDPYAQMVVEHARQLPASFLDGLRRKALYTLGWFDRLIPAAGRSTFYIVVWALAIAGVFLMRAAGSTMPFVALGIPLAVAASHFAVVVAIFPHVYGDRLILPFYVLLIPYVAVALAAAAQAVSGAGVDAPAAVLLGIAALAAVWTVAPHRIGFDFHVSVMAVAFVGAVLGRREWPCALAWICAVVAAALTTTLLLDPSAAAATELRRQLAFVAVVVSTAALARSVRLFARRVPLQGRPAWIAIAALAAGAGLTTSALTALSAAQTTLDAVSLHVYGWPAAAALISDHRWFGAGLGAAAFAGLRPGGAMLWFLVSAGVVGVLGYLAIWLRAIWRTGTQALDWRWAALHGVLLAAFAAIQGANLVGGSTAMPGVLLALGLVLGLAETSHVSTLRVEPTRS
jgi:hypothetical protein